MIDHTGIFVTDPAKSTAFYDAVFGALGASLLMTCLLYTSRCV